MRSLAERRAGGGTHLVAAGAGRWRAQLGLPLHVGTGCCLLGVRAAARRVSGRGPCVPRLGARRVRKSRGPRIMYDLGGGPVPDEWEDVELEGYRASSPVRWGNGAADQRQHDVYGEVLDCAYQWVSGGGQIEPHLWGRLADIADTAGDAWREPDQGIWEIRS